ncbi:hypothetical protein K501DRAFT_276590 [Backusella circina FSU 941]|nr:hypothetical protein K501DRAFT_276590 [Backusella circina FSU 941]
MARLGLLYIATLALALVVSAAPCHDKGEVSTGEPADGLEYLDHDIGNFESDDDLGESDDELDADELAGGGLDPSELDESPFLDDGRDFGEDDFMGPEDDFMGPEDDFTGPEDDFMGPDEEFGHGDEFDPDCYERRPNGGRGSGGRGLINISAGHIGTGGIDASGIAENALRIAGLGIHDNLQDLTAA